MGIDITKLRLNILESLKGKIKNFLKKSSIKIAKIIKFKKEKFFNFFKLLPRIRKIFILVSIIDCRKPWKKGKGFCQ